MKSNTTRKCKWRVRSIIGKIGWNVDRRREEGIEYALESSHGSCKESVGYQDTNNIVCEHATEWKPVGVIWC